VMANLLARGGGALLCLLALILLQLPLEYLGATRPGRSLTCISCSTLRS
jgi:hypothetical protein